MVINDAKSEEKAYFAEVGGFSPVGSEIFAS